MKTVSDLTGRRFGKLTVIAYFGAHRSPCGAIAHRWTCQCECGGGKVAIGGNLKRGLTTSCGCVHRAAITRHGFTAHPLYKTWREMMNRCYDPKSRDFERYGFRGVSVDKRWQSFSPFAEDMGPKPTPLHTLDRINGDGDYGPGNCRWATQTEQNTNKASTRVVELRGQRLSFAAAMRRLGYTPRSGYLRSRCYSETAQQVVDHYATKGAL